MVPSACRPIWRLFQRPPSCALFVAGPLALIDRNFQGFGKELFTDAGKYVIHFGDKPNEAASQATKTIQAAHPDKPAPAVTAVAKYRNPDMHIIATSTADQLVRLPPPWTAFCQDQSDMTWKLKKPLLTQTLSWQFVRGMYGQGCGAHCLCVWSSNQS